MDKGPQASGGHVGVKRRRGKHSTNAVGEEETSSVAGAAAAPPKSKRKHPSAGSFALDTEQSTSGAGEESSAQATVASADTHGAGPDAATAPTSVADKKARKPRAKKLTPAEQLIAGFDGAAHPYAARSHWVGYHCSAAGGLYNAVLHARATHARAFAFFTRPRGSWVCPALQEEDAAKFRAACVEHGYGREHILPHGTYLTNAGSSDPVIRGKTLDALVDEAARCAALGIGLYNFHPGSAASCAGGRDECLRNVAAAIDHVHAKVPGVVMVIETMAGGGSVVCSTFEEIAAVIALVGDKGRVGVCIDTAHIHAAGYDVRTPGGYAAMMADFERVVGLHYLRGMHLNDSAASLGSKKDRHWHIGRGAVGLDAFRAIMTDARTAGIPLILETPASAKAFLPKYAAEVELLYSLDGEGASGSGTSAGRSSSGSDASAGVAATSSSSAASLTSSSCDDTGAAGGRSHSLDCLAVPSAAGPSGVAASAVAEAASEMLLAASLPEGSVSAAAVVEAASASLPPAAGSLPLKAVAADACSAILAASRTGSVPAATAYTPLPDFMRAIAGLSAEGVAVLAAFPAPVVLAGPAKGGSRKKAAKAGSAAAAGAGGGGDGADEDEDGGDEEVDEGEGDE